MDILNYNSESKFHYSGLLSDFCNSFEIRITVFLSALSRRATSAGLKSLSSSLLILFQTFLVIRMRTWRISVGYLMIFTICLNCAPAAAFSISKIAISLLVGIAPASFILSIPSCLFSGVLEDTPSQST